MCTCGLLLHLLNAPFNAATAAAAIADEDLGIQFALLYEVDTKPIPNKSFKGVNLLDDK